MILALPFATLPYAEIFYVSSLVWQLILAWWWLPLPFVLWRPFSFLWLWWRAELWGSKIKYIMLEIRLPKEIIKPLKAMENVFAGFWATYDPPHWKEKWWDGKYLLSLSLEIVSLGGKIHFFIRTPDFLKNLIEASIYSQYPEVEVTEVPDYILDFPDNLPNEEYDLWGCSYQTIKEDVYPIRTYLSFFEEEGEKIVEEAKRIDPLANLLEGMAKLKPGENLWIQFLIKPLTNAENNLLDRGKETIAKIVGRKIEKPKEKPILQEAAEILIFGVEEKEAKKEEAQSLEMKLTPGEREVVKAIEDKMSKYFFEVAIRFIYLAKKEVFYKPNIKMPISFFVQFSTQNLNGLKPFSPTVTGVPYFMVKYRVAYRKRRIYRLYRHRLPPLYPLASQVGGKEGVMVLNTEELTTLFHFPSEILVPTPAIKRVETKRGGAPPGLPVGP
jgi:hypothetical protein